MGALLTYTTQVQRLLHDTSGTFWPAFNSSPAGTELTDYINEARNRVAQDTKCLRQLVTNATYGLTLTQGVEAYNPTTFLPAAIGPLVIDVMGITVYWGNTRQKLEYKAFSEFDALYRYWNQLQSIPNSFTRMSPIQILIGPMPDQNYSCDFEVCLNPTKLVDDTTVDQIPVAFTEPVQYWATYKAKFKEQSLGECEIFKKEYFQSLLRSQRAYMTRVLANPYR